MKTLFILNLILGVAAFAQPASSVSDQTVKIKTIEERLLELERQQNEMHQWYSEYYIQSKDRVTPFLGEKISLGGFFESAVTNVSGPDTLGQTSTNANTIGINLAADFNEQMRFVAQYLTAQSYAFQNPHNNPLVTPSQRQFGPPSFLTLVAQAYVEYRETDAFIVQSGLGYVPFGQAFQQREPVLFRRRSGPQLVSAADSASVGLAFPLWLGLHVLGSFSVGEGRVGYDLYSFTPSTNSKTIGGGTRLWWTDSQNITMGVSLQSAEQTSNFYTSYGADVNLKFNNIGLVAEYARSVISGTSESLSSYYIEPYISFYDGKWLVYGVADYINNRNRTVGAVTDPYEKWVFGGGINWLPIPNVRFRFGVLTHNYLNDTDSIGGQRRDYSSLDLSTGIAF